MGNHRNKIAIIVLAIILVGGAFYVLNTYVFDTGGAGLAIGSDSSRAKNIQKKIKALEQLDTDIFEAPKFQALKELRLNISGPEAITKGKRNPFERE